jgi:hypothetical protein
MSNQLWSKDNLSDLFMSFAFSDTSNPEEKQEFLQRVTHNMRVLVENPPSKPSYLFPTNAPVNGGRVNQAMTWAIGARLTAQPITERQASWLGALDKGDGDIFTFATMWMSQDGDKEYIDALFAGDDDKLNSMVPPEMLMSDDEFDVAVAFYEQQLVKPVQAPIQFTGEATIKRTGIKMLDTLPKHYDEIRLVVMPDGIYGSMVFDSGVVPFFWSQRGDTLRLGFGQRYGLAFALYFSGLWQDLHTEPTVIERIISKKKQKGALQASKSASRGNTPHGTIYLPKRIYNIQYADDNLNQWQASNRARAIRAHYRRLQNGHTMSTRAHDLCNDYGFPIPPQGFTFVSPSHTEATASPISAPRIVAKGLHITKAVLKDWS